MSSQSKNGPLVVLALVLALAAGLLASGSLGNRDQRFSMDDDEGDITSLQPSGSQAQAFADKPVEQDRGASLRELQPLLGELKVVVVDAKGVNLSRAKITLIGPDGEQRQIFGTGNLSDLSAGPWSVRGEFEALLPRSTQIEVEAGKTQQVVLQLLDHLRITGRLMDDHGTPLERERIWLLSPGQSHPLTDKIGLGVLSCLSGRAGRFQLQVPDPGAYRFSVGPPGQPRWQQAQTKKLNSDGSNFVDIVIPSEGRLEVRMGPLPANRDADRVHCRIEVQINRRPGSRLATVPGQGTGKTRRNRGKEKRTADQSSKDPAPPEQAGKPKKRSPKKRSERQELPREPDPFVRWSTASIPIDEVLSLEGTPSDVEIRLVLIHRKHRYIGDTVFKLADGVTTRATFSWPLKDSPAEFAALLVERIPPDPELPKVGCHWYEE